MEYFSLPISQHIALSGIYQYIIYPTLLYVNVCVRISFLFFLVMTYSTQSLFPVSSISLLSIEIHE